MALAACNHRQRRGRAGPYCSGGPRTERRRLDLEQPGRTLGRVVSDADGEDDERDDDPERRYGVRHPAAIPGMKSWRQDWTAEAGPTDDPHSWFVGLRPADDPQVAVAVIMEIAVRHGLRDAGRAGRPCSRHSPSTAVGRAGPLSGGNRL